MSTQLPSPPFHNVPNINNLRDASLFPLLTPSGPIRPHTLFRSADVSALDTPGWRTLRTLGIARVFDLRSAPEVARGWAGAVGGASDVKPGWVEKMEAAGVQRSWVPVFKEEDYSPERLAERYVKYMDESAQGFVDAYRDILRNGGAAYREIFMYLANLPAPGPGTQSQQGENGEGGHGALIHCTAGKDRTGIFFGVLFDFLGVERGDIAREYNLTEQGLGHVREEVVERLLQSPGFKRYARALMAGRAVGGEEIAGIVGAEGDDAGEVEVPAEIREKGRLAALRMVGAREESMLLALEMLDREWGSAEAYMRKECGLGDEDLVRLRRNLIIQE